MIRVIVSVVIALGTVPIAADREPLAEFQERVEAYAILRREIAERPRPRLDVTSDPRVLTDACEAIATGLVRARPRARVGDVIVPSVAPVLKARIARVATPEALRIWYHQLYSEGQHPPRRRVGVHARVPCDEFSPVVPSDLLEALPTLPPELAYRLAGRDLLLVDPDAALVIDVLPEALPAALRP